MKLLIKLGGALLDSHPSRQRLAQEIALLARSGGHQIVVVHGGGKQLTRHLAARGIESRFVNGLRVTTPETLDAVIKVLAGEVNLSVVGAFERAGARAVGLTGADSALAHAVQLSPELGAVGRVEHVRAELLDLLTSHGYLPVVACLAGGAHGEIYNVNADEMAAACAASWRADRLIFLTDVDGVLDANRRPLPQLTAPEAKDLIRRGLATGGMEAKLRACLSALGRGVPEVRIVPGSVTGILELVLAYQPVGTAVIAAVPA